MLGIRLGEPTASGLIARKLLDTWILTVVPPSYLERHGRPRKPADLLGHRYIQYRDPQSRRLFAWEFRRRDKVALVEVSGALTVGDVGTLLAACSAGVGVAQIMALGSRRLLESGACGALPGLAGLGILSVRLLLLSAPTTAKVRALTDFCVALACDMPEAPSVT